MIVYQKILLSPDIMYLITNMAYDCVKNIQPITRNTCIYKSITRATIMEKHYLDIKNLLNRILCHDHTVKAHSAYISTYLFQ